jgi:dTDP-4-dehydrorhamnose 3,5-epimerase
VPEIIESEVIADVIIVEPSTHGDERGRFVETYRRSWFPLGREMTQANRSEKQAGAIVGLHYHLHQADYWYVLRGTAGPPRPPPGVPDRRGHPLTGPRR